MSFFGELRRRNVVKVAVAYAIVGWLLIEITSTVFPTLQLPVWTVTFVTMLLLLGFPVALLLSWAYELTPEGVKKTKAVPLNDSVTHLTGRKIDFVIIGLLVLAVGYLVVDDYVLVDSDQEAVVQKTATPTVEVETPLPVVAEEQPEALPNSVAVLLCANLSPDSDDAYFAAGIHEEILNQLVKIADLNVIARTSVLRFANTALSIPQIAAELNVEAVMECSVRFAGSAILVTAQLIDPETDTHLWSDTYPGDLSDLSTIFAMQADIATNIAKALEAEFSLEEQERIERIPTDSPRAYELYVRAGQIGGDIGLAYLDQAIDLDPNFAEAYALRGWINAPRLIGDLARDETITDRLEMEALVRTDLEKALALDPNVGLAYRALAFLHEANWRGVEAEEVYQRAYQLLPNESSVLRGYARFKMWTDQPEAAISLATRATELAPNDSFAFRMLGVVHEHVGSLDEAYNAFYRARSLGSPGNVGGDQLNVARIEFVLGHTAEAQRELRLLESIALNSNNSVTLAVLAYGYSRLGLQEDAARVLATYDERAADRTLATSSRVIANLARNDEERALEWINTAANIKEPYLGQALIMRIRANAFRDPILDKPEFLAARERLGFTDL